MNVSDRSHFRFSVAPNNNIIRKKKNRFCVDIFYTHRVHKIFRKISLVTFFFSLYTLRFECLIFFLFIFNRTKWSTVRKFLLTIENRPDTIQTISAILTLPVCMRTPVGETKIPDPIIDPTITVHPFNKLIFAFRPTSPPPSPLSPPFFSSVNPFMAEFFLE